MIGKTISHYEITEKLGEGGMGVVYRARDTKLDRDVAIKFLPPHLIADKEARKRFIHEAKSASAIDNQHICTIYEIDETDDGTTFIVMAFYEGETLRKRIDRGGIAPGEALHIISQAAAGLARAHAKDIVHRDIKPQNILITDEGEVKIIDFGLAKLAGRTKLTRDGSALGTAAYMSPEQARGEVVDHRSDIFSLGSILYEMLAGEPPFKGEHEAALLYGIVHEEPAAISEKCADIDPRLCGVIAKGLMKDPGDRYQSAGEMKDDLKALKDLSKGHVGRHTPTRTGRGISRRNLLIGIVAVAVIAVVIGYLAISRREPAPLTAAEMSLAVVDFRDMAAEPDPVVSKSITELLNTSLVESCPIRVQSPERVRECRRQLFGSVNALIEEGQELEIARKSAATYLLTGSISIVGDNGFITWRLIDVISGTMIKAGTVEPGRMMTVVDKIVESVLPEIAAASGVEQVADQISVAQISTSSTKAFEHYVRGKIEHDLGRPVEALDQYTKAVELDSSFALAWSAMSRLYAGETLIRHDEVLARKYRETALRHDSRMGIKERMQLHALGLDGVKQLEKLKEILELWPDDRETLQMIARRARWYWMWEECIRYSQIGLALYPEDPIFGGENFISSLITTERIEEAKEASEKYIGKFPDEPEAWAILAESYIAMGHPDSAEAIYNRIMRRFPDGSRDSWAMRRIARCGYHSGELEESISLYSDLLADTNLDESTRQAILYNYSHYISLPYVYREAGRYSDALRTLNKAKPYFRDQSYPWELRMGYFLADIGNNEGALKLAAEMLASDYEDHESRHRFARRFMGKAQVDDADIQGARETVSVLDEAAQIYGPYYKYQSYITQAYIALAQDQVALAKKHLDNASKLTSGMYNMFGIELNTLLADANKLAGDLEEAVSIHNELLRINGGHALSHYELGKLYEELSRPEDAMRHYERFLEMWKNADEGLPQPEHAREGLEALRSQI